MQWRTSQAVSLRRMDIQGDLFAEGRQRVRSVHCKQPGHRQGRLRHDLGYLTPLGKRAKRTMCFCTSAHRSWRGQAANFVFAGVNGAPRPTSATRLWVSRADKTTLPTTPVSREAAFLCVENNKFEVFVPMEDREQLGTQLGRTERQGRQGDRDR